VSKKKLSVVLGSTNNQNFINNMQNYVNNLGISSRSNGSEVLFYMNGEDASPGLVGGGLREALVGAVQKQQRTLMYKVNVHSTLIIPKETFKHVFFNILTYFIGILQANY